MMRRLVSYLSARRALLALYLLTLAVILTLGFLAGQDGVYVRYETILVTFSLVCVLAVDGARYRRKRRSLEQIGGRTALVPRELPEPLDALGADYDALLRTLAAENAALQQKHREESEEQLSYYTLWVHQIKTPIAAMRLLQDGEMDERARLLRMELFRVEQYADLALKFVKLGDISGDLVAEYCDLNEIARAAVRKYSLLFVYSKLGVQIEPLEERVPTDAMWLEFILCQLLSNSLKYTRAGGVRIYMEEGALVVQDTGIGIRKEDLPRIFEKGYTGYNGRMDTRASGIGLYLVKRTADALRIRVSVESAPGAGTQIKLRFPADDAFARG